jgi:hypothetical protein
MSVGRKQISAILFLTGCLAGLLFTDRIARAADTPENRSYELGELIAILLPPRRQKLDWKHPIGPDVAWETSTYDGTIRRMAQVDVHVLGKRTTALEQDQKALLWTLTLKGPSKKRPTQLELMPGSENEQCNPTRYSGCQFEIAPSLEKAGIRSKWTCGVRDELFQIAGYELVTSDNRKGYLLELVGNGNTWLTLMFSKTQLFKACRPGTPIHDVSGGHE